MRFNEKYWFGDRHFIRGKRLGDLRMVLKLREWWRVKKMMASQHPAMPAHRGAGLGESCARGMSYCWCFVVELWGPSLTRWPLEMEGVLEQQPHHQMRRITKNIFDDDAIFAVMINIGEAMFVFYPLYWISSQSLRSLWLFDCYDPAAEGLPAKPPTTMTFTSGAVNFSTKRLNGTGSRWSAILGSIGIFTSALIIFLLSLDSSSHCSSGGKSLRARASSVSKVKFELLPPLWRYLQGIWRVIKSFSSVLWGGPPSISLRRSWCRRQGQRHSHEWTMIAMSPFAGSIYPHRRCVLSGWCFEVFGAKGLDGQDERFSGGVSGHCERWSFEKFQIEKGARTRRFHYVEVGSWRLISRILDGLPRRTKGALDRGYLGLRFQILAMGRPRYQCLWKPDLGISSD